MGAIVWPLRTRFHDSSGMIEFSSDAKSSFMARQSGATGTETQLPFSSTKFIFDDRRRSIHRRDGADFLSISAGNDTLVLRRHLFSLFFSFINAEKIFKKPRTHDANRIFIFFQERNETKPLKFDAPRRKRTFEKLESIFFLFLFLFLLLFFFFFLFILRAFSAFSLSLSLFLSFWSCVFNGRQVALKSPTFPAFRESLSLSLQGLWGSENGPIPPARHHLHTAGANQYANIYLRAYPGFISMIC